MHCIFILFFERKKNVWTMAQDPARLIMTYMRPNSKQISCSWHQFTNLFSPIDEYFFNEISCYDYSNDTVICILMNPSRFRKCWMISIQKNNKVINISIKKKMGIGELENWRIDVTNKIFFPKIQRSQSFKKKFF